MPLAQCFGIPVQMVIVLVHPIYQKMSSYPKEVSLCAHLESMQRLSKPVACGQKKPETNQQQPNNLFFVNRNGS